MIRCLIAFIILAVPSAAQPSIVTSGGRGSIVISGSVSKPAAVILPVVTERPRPVILPVAPASKPQSPNYIVAFTASWCGPCKMWKSTQLPKLKAAGVAVTIVDVDEQPQWGVQSLPTFWVVDRKTRRAKTKLVGITAATTLQKLATETGVTVLMQRQAPRYNIYNGGRGSSHESRSSLINHLLNEGTHAGKHTQSQLQSMTDQQLDDLHTEDHRTNGQVRTIHQPAQRLTQRSRLPVVNTQWGRIDLETYSRNCNCPMCRGIRALQSQYRTMSIVTPESAVSPAQEPTPADTIDQMMDLMPLTSRDVLADLGCGDGRILIEAVLRFGCTGIGVEIDPEMAEKARVRVENEGLSSKIGIITGDVLDFEPSEHGVTAAVTFLFPELLAKLNDKLRGIPVVASPFHEIHGLGMTEFGDVWIKKPNPEMN